MLVITVSASFRELYLSLIARDEEELAKAATTFLLLFAAFSFQWLSNLNWTSKLNVVLRECYSLQ